MWFVFVTDLCARKFENMKKRYSKKRCSVTKAVEAVELARAKKNLEAYSFLDWLNPYIRIRTVVTESILNESKSMVQIVPQSQNIAKNPEDNNNHQPPFQLENEDMGNQNEAKNKAVGEIANGKMRKRKRDEKEVSMSEEESFSLEPPTMGYVEPVKISDVDAVSRNADQAFANMVAAELSSFPPHIKYCIKHEVNNIFFKYHTAEFEQQNVTAIPTPDH